MVDANVIASKLAELADRVARVRRHCPADAEALAEDQDAFDLVAFNLMLAVQACVDVAGHLIADQGWAPPKDLREACHRLQEHGILSRETAGALARAAGLHNVVAHLYAQAAPELVFRAATSGLADLERFSREVAGWVTGRSEA